MCIDFLYQNIEQIGSLATTKLEEIPDFYTHFVTSTKEDSLAIDAFKVYFLRFNLYLLTIRRFFRTTFKAWQ